MNFITNQDSQKQYLFLHRKMMKVLQSPVKKENHIYSIGFIEVNQ